MLKNVDPQQLELILDLLQSYLLYAVVGVLILIAISAILVKLIAPDKLKGFTQLSIGIAIGFAVGTVFCLFCLDTCLMILEDDISYVFWMSVALIAIIAFAVIICCIIKAIKPTKFKLSIIISTAIILTYSIAYIVAIIPAADPDCEPISPALFYTISGLLVVIMSGIVLIFGKKGNKTHTTKSITYAAVCIALSYALSYVKLFSMPQGGSVTFASLLPILIYSYMFGVKKGVACGLIYGMLQFLQSPQAYHPMQVLLDYPIAFGFVGFAGLFKDIFPHNRGFRLLEFTIGATIAVILRYVSHIVSGTFVFHYGAELSAALLYSIVYNMYTLVDLAIVIACGIFVLTNKSFNTMLDKVQISGNVEN